MTVREYIIEKNKLIYDQLGLILVPEDQIIDIEPMKISEEADYLACPYCIKYLFCHGCPMNKADNNCNNLNSSYGQCVEAANKTNLVQSIKGLPELIAKYNNELLEGNN
jgi:hypothetical protein